MALPEETTETRFLDPFASAVQWRSGAIAGFLAALAMALVISAGNVAVLRNAIAGLYTLEGSLLAGVATHLVHGTAFGVVFAVVMADPGLYRLTDWAWKTVAAGIVYGFLLAVFGAGILMPVWLAAVGFASPPQIPNVTLPLLLWHVVYGTVLGAVYYALESGDSRAGDDRSEGSPSE